MSNIMTRWEQKMLELKEIMAKQPPTPEYTNNDLEKDTAMATSWHEVYKVWAAEFDAKFNELENEVQEENS